MTIILPPSPISEDAAILFNMMVKDSLLSSLREVLLYLNLSSFGQRDQLLRRLLKEVGIVFTLND